MGGKGIDGEDNWGINIPIYSKNLSVISGEEPLCTHTCEGGRPEMACKWLIYMGKFSSLPFPPGGIYYVHGLGSYVL